MAVEDGSFHNRLCSRYESFAYLGVRTCERLVDDDHGIAELDGINPARRNHLRQGAKFEKPAEQVDQAGGLCSVLEIHQVNEEFEKRGGGFPAMQVTSIMRSIQGVSVFDHVNATRFYQRKTDH